LKKFISTNFKISQVDCPLLANFLFEPFLFGNFAMVGHVKEPDQITWRDKLRYSLGFGVSCQLPSIAIEFYYSMLVKMGQNEQKSTMQINIGID
jgi:outer membrane protein assembly factor BamA